VTFVDGARITENANTVQGGVLYCLKNKTSAQAIVTVRLLHTVGTQNVKFHWLNDVCLLAGGHISPAQV